MSHDDIFSGSVFPPPMPLRVGASFGVALGRAQALARGGIRCFAPVGAEAAAQEYLELIGGPLEDVTVLDPSSALAEIAVLDPEVWPLLVLPATLPDYRDQFFGHPWFHFFADHHYRPCPNHQSPALFTVGTTARALAALALLHGPTAGATARAAEDRRQSMRLRHGEKFIDDALLSRVLRSCSGATIRLHSLGPEGTNIAKAGRLFLRRHGLEPESSIVVHERKVEPLEYAAIAASEAHDGILPLHMECAVFYDMHTLFAARRDEVVFAGHQYMPLDEMQIATRCRDVHQRIPADRLVVASHPSPRGLARPLTMRGAELVTASSNSDAAVMVAEGRADACITTESARQRTGLETLHRFGCPMMLFTVGTPLSVPALFDHLHAPFGVRLASDHLAASR